MKIPQTITQAPAISLAHKRGFPFLALSVALFAGLLLISASRVSAEVRPPVAPLIFEKPNTGEIEILWFHPEFHRTTIGNLLQSPPSRYGHPSESDETAMIVSHMAIQAPFGVSRVAAAFNPADPLFGFAGDQYTPLNIQLAVSRGLVALNPTDIPLQLLDSSGISSSAESDVSVSFNRGDSLYLGFQWQSGSPTQPMLGIQAGLEGFADQSYVSFNSPTPTWDLSPEYYGMEVDLHDWRERGSDGLNSFWYTQERPTFTVWYSPDTLRPLESSYDWASVMTDRLSWRTQSVGSGFVGLYSEDSAANRSDTVFAQVDIGLLGALKFSKAKMYFDWTQPSSLSQDLAIHNTGPKTTVVTMISDNPLISFDVSTFSVSGGGSFSLRKVSAIAAPLAFDTVEAAIYIYNNQGWMPVKMDVYLVPDLQTSVEDDLAAKPVSFGASDVFPNPTRGPGELRITSERSRRFMISIYNVLGQELQSSEIQARGEVSVPIQIESGLNFPSAAGVYFVRISSEGESLMRKFVLLK